MRSISSKGGNRGFINTNALAVIEERTTESGFNEALDRKEEEYKMKIEALEKRIEDINGITNLTREEIADIMLKKDDVEAR
jgi:hypothetical protein